MNEVSFVNSLKRESERLDTTPVRTYSRQALSRWDSLLENERPPPKKQHSSFDLRKPLVRSMEVPRPLLRKQMLLPTVGIPVRSQRRTAYSLHLRSSPKPVNLRFYINRGADRTRAKSSKAFKVSFNRCVRVREMLAPKKAQPKTIGKALNITKL